MRPVQVPVRKGVVADSSIGLGNFFAKPHLIYEGIIGVGTGNIFNDSIGSYLTTNTRWKDKMEGYGYIRATAVIRVTINAQPFQQGRVILSVIPMANRFSADYKNMRRGHFCAITQLPNVEIDFRDTAGELRIPYATPSYWFETHGLMGLSQNYDWGDIDVRMLSAMRVGSGPNNCGISIWLSFEDVEFGMPIAPQSGVRAGRPGRTRRVKKIGSEEEEMHNGPISSALSRIGQAATVLQGIPLLSSYVSPVTWAANVGANLASSFGFSKPNNGASATFFAHRPYRGVCNSEGVTNAEPLSLVAQPVVEIEPGFAATGIDEMAFDYLKQIEAYCESFVWSETNVQSDLIYNKFVNVKLMVPSSFLTTSTGTYTANYEPPAFHLAKYFAMHRGSIKMTLKFIKTDFHSGRIQVVYCPWPLDSTHSPAATVEADQYSLREIIDVRERSEVTLSLPYMCNSNYRINEVSAQISVRVVNALRSPDTASNSMEVLCYFSGGEDFELACPIGSQTTVITPQSGLSSSTTRISRPIANTAVADSSTQYAVSSIGDSFTSVKQLVMRYSKPSACFFPAGGSGVATFWFANHAKSPNSGLAHDMLSQLSSGYLLCRGSLRYILFMVPEAGGNLGVASAQLTKDTLNNLKGFVANYGSFDSASTGIHGGPLVPFQDSRGGVEVMVPYYSQTNSTIVQYSVDSSVRTDSSIPRTRLNWGSEPAARVSLLRSAGDDFTFGMFVGFAPTFVQYVPI